MKRRFLLPALCLFAAGPALADPPTPIAEVVVTATRLPSRLDQTPDAYVIDARELELRDVIFAEDALATVPGVTVTSSGPFGGLTSVQLRGLTTDKTLVVIDGVPVNDASQPAGGFDFATTDLFDVARIEVLTGPQSSLWGSDAIGGVVAITTREPDGVRAVAEGGSLATARGALSAGLSRDAYALGVSVSGLRTDGISKAAAGTERDPFSTWSTRLNGRIALSDRVTLDGKASYVTGRAATDGYPPPDYVLGDTSDVYRTESFTGSVRVTAKALFGLDHELSLLGEDGLRADTCPASPLYCGGPYKYRYDRGVVRYTAGFGAAEAPVAATFGVERKTDDARLSDGSTRHLGETSAFAIARINPFRRLSTSLSLRYDAPDRYRSVLTGKATGVYDLGGGFRLSASWGQGFKTPTISELACDFCYTPPVALRPEHAQGEDVGLAWRSANGAVALQATVFSLDVRDALEYGPGHYVNIERLRSRGIESQATLNLTRGLYARATYSYTDSRDVTAGTAQLRVPRNQGSIVLGWTGSRAHLAMTVRAEGHTPDIAPDFSPAARPGFGVADLSGGLKLNAHLEATLSVRNVTNAHYQEALGYGETGAFALAGLRLRY